MKKPAPKKALNVKVIPRLVDGEVGDDGRPVVAEPYQILDRIRYDHHPHLAAARIALAWRYGWEPDRDGRLILGQCRRASDLDRALHDYDAVILLNRSVWQSADFTPAQKEALIDHELCHLQVLKKDGQVVKDEHDRTVYRLRKHDLEEFRDVVARHGLYKADLEEFAAVIRQRQRSPLFRPEGPVPRPVLAAMPEDEAQEAV